MPIAVVGMHRSGTSMVARLLQLCGLDLGPADQFLPPQPDNPEGFWEFPAFVALNEDILKSAGGWWNVPPLQPIVGTDDCWKPFRERMAALPGDIGMTEPWGWKDPRTSLTLPVWTAVWPDLRIVICLRNPLEVAQSLSDRDSFTYLIGLKLWQTYYTTIVQSIPASRRIVTSYDSYFLNGEAELRRVRDALGFPPDDDRLHAALATIAPRLRHTRVSIQEMQSLELPGGVTELYRDLSAEAGVAPEPPTTRDPLSPQLFAQLLRSENQFEIQAERIRELERQLAERKAHIEWLNGLVADMRRHLDMQHEQLMERCERVRDLEARLSARRYHYADRIARTVERVRHPFRK